VNTETMTVIQTDRLTLRPWAPGDLDALAAIFAEQAVWRFPFGRGLDREATEQFIARQISHQVAHGFGLWAAELNTDRCLIGYIGLAVPTWLPEVLPAVEVGWRLHPDHWGRGLATEGGRAALEYGFDRTGLDRIISIYDPKNVASGRVMEKLGMRPWRRATDPVRSNVLAVHELNRQEWAGSGRTSG
jgi:RimJ/RimL family protein N-acetyltransferase